MKFIKLALLLSLVSAQAFGATIIRKSYIEKTITPNTSTSPAYSQNDAIGTGGACVLTGLSFSAGTQTVLDSLSLSDVDAKLGPVDLLFFNAPLDVQPADNAALLLSTDDLQTKFVGSVSITTNDYVAAGTGASVASRRDIQLAMRTSSTTGSLYVQAVARGAPTFVSTSAIKIKLNFVQQ